MFVEGNWDSSDGLKLHYRYYEGRAAAPATSRLRVLCLHGLTRNSRDFANLAEHLAENGHDILVPEMRGRGQSEAAREPEDYTVENYVADVELLLAQFGWDRFVSIGTSMGGLMTVILATTDAERLEGAVINDVGPRLDKAGLERIAAGVGRSSSFPTWMHAARELMNLHGAIHPTWELPDWINHAKRVMRLNSSGKIVSDHDPRIGQAFGDPTALAEVDGWPAWQALDSVPTLLIRGELSDLLTVEDAEKAVAVLSDARLVTVPDVGHAPMLDEPEALAAIDAFLARIEGTRPRA